MGRGRWIGGAGIPARGGIDPGLSGEGTEHTCTCTSRALAFLEFMVHSSLQLSCPRASLVRSPLRARDQITRP